MNTLFVGHNLIELEQVDSTNNYADQLLAREKVPEGTVILAKQQLAGRGQRGNVWHSAPFQNLTFSLILKPSFLGVEQQFLLSQAVALGLRDFLQELLPGVVSVKWPNDVLFNGVKISGILIETQLRGSILSEAIVGIGLNVNQISFPEEVVATSLKLESGTHFDFKACLSGLCEKLEQRYLQLRSGDQTALQEAYWKHLYRRYEWHPFLHRGNQIQARIVGVESNGRLRLETANHEEILCDFRELAHLP